MRDRGQRRGKRGGRKGGRDRDTRDDLGVWESTATCVWVGGQRRGNRLWAIEVHVHTMYMYISEGKGEGEGEREEGS